MGCGCNRKSMNPAGFEFTSPSGEKRVYLTNIEARIAMNKAGGGRIVPVAASQQQ